MSEWATHIDKATGHPFYQNTKTQEVTWDKPKGLQEKVVPERPKGIEQQTKKFENEDKKDSKSSTNMDEPSLRASNGLRVVKEGYIHKKGHVMKNWKTRYFVITRDGITYWETGACVSQKGSIPINETTEVKLIDKDGHRYFARFEVRTTAAGQQGMKGGGGKQDIKYIVATDTSTQRDEWVEAIEEIIAARRRFLMES